MLKGTIGFFMQREGVMMKRCIAIILVIAMLLTITNFEAVQVYAHDAQSVTVSSEREFTQALNNPNVNVITWSGDLADPSVPFIRKHQTIIHEHRTVTLQFYADNIPDGQYEVRLFQGYLGDDFTLPTWDTIIISHYELIYLAGKVNVRNGKFKLTFHYPGINHITEYMDNKWKIFIAHFIYDSVTTINFEIDLVGYYTKIGERQVDVRPPDQPQPTDPSADPRFYDLFVGREVDGFLRPIEPMIESNMIQDNRWGTLIFHPQAGTFWRHDIIFVSNEEELFALNCDEWGIVGGIIVLTNDIFLTREWVPFHFFGFFDGRGYSINNLYVLGERDVAGLFSYASGIITNLKLNIGPQGINGRTAGGIVGANFGRNSSPTIINSVVTGDVLGTNIAGGVIGVHALYDHGIDEFGIFYTVFNGSIVSQRIAGGLIGTASTISTGRHATISSSHAHGSIQVERGPESHLVRGILVAAGGLIGGLQVFSSLEIINSHSTICIDISLSENNTARYSLVGAYAGGLLGTTMHTFGWLDVRENRLQRGSLIITDSSSVSDVTLYIGAWGTVFQAGAGGLIGFSQYRLNIVNSSASGAITAISPYGYDSVVITAGGLVSNFIGTEDDRRSEIINSYSSPDQVVQILDLRGNRICGATNALGLPEAPSDPSGTDIETKEPDLVIWAPEEIRPRHGEYTVTIRLSNGCLMEHIVPAPGFVPTQPTRQTINNVQVHITLCRFTYFAPFEQYDILLENYTNVRVMKGSTQLFYGLVPITQLQDGSQTITISSIEFISVEYSTPSVTFDIRGRSGLIKYLATGDGVSKSSAYTEISPYHRILDIRRVDDSELIRGPENPLFPFNYVRTLFGWGGISYWYYAADPRRPLTGRWDVPNDLMINSDVTIPAGANIFVSGRITITGSRNNTNTLTLAPNSRLTGRSITVESHGLLVMQNNSNLDVSGNFLFNSNHSHNGLLTGGTARVGGNIEIRSSGNIFAATGNNTFEMRNVGRNLTVTSGSTQFSNLILPQYGNIRITHEIPRVITQTQVTGVLSAEPLSPIPVEGVQFINLQGGGALHPIIEGRVSTALAILSLNQRDFDRAVGRIDVDAVRLESHRSGNGRGHIVLYDVADGRPISFRVSFSGVHNTDEISELLDRFGGIEMPTVMLPFGTGTYQRLDLNGNPLGTAVRFSVTATAEAAEAAVRELQDKGITKALSYISDAVDELFSKFPELKLAHELLRATNLDRATGLLTFEGLDGSEILLRAIKDYSTSPDPSRWVAFWEFVLGSR